MFSKQIGAKSDKNSNKNNIYYSTMFVMHVMFVFYCLLIIYTCTKKRKCFHTKHAVISCIGIIGICDLHDRKPIVLTFKLIDTTFSILMIAM